MCDERVEKREERADIARNLSVSSRRSSRSVLHEGETRDPLSEKSIDTLLVIRADKKYRYPCRAGVEKGRSR